MSKQTEALKLALEALEYISSHYMSLPKIGCMALAAVEEALAEQPAQQQEPVAWATQLNEYAHIKWGAKRPDYPIRYEVPLYTSPPAQQQEPVAWMHPDGRIWTFGRGFDKSTFTIPLYTSPPASKPLSVEKIAELDCNDHYKFARAIEAAHGIKENT